MQKFLVFNKNNQKDRERERVSEIEIGRERDTDVVGGGFLPPLPQRKFEIKSKKLERKRL